MGVSGSVSGAEYTKWPSYPVDVKRFPDVWTSDGEGEVVNFVYRYTPGTMNSKPPIEYQVDDVNSGCHFNGTTLNNVHHRAAGRGFR